MENPNSIFVGRIEIGIEMQQQNNYPHILDLDEAQWPPLPAPKIPYSQHKINKNKEQLKPIEGGPSEKPLYPFPFGRPQNDDRSGKNKNISKDDDDDILECIDNLIFKEMDYEEEVKWQGPKFVQSRNRPLFDYDAFFSAGIFCCDDLIKLKASQKPLPPLVQKRHKSWQNIGDDDDDPGWESIKNMCIEKSREKGKTYEWLNKMDKNLLEGFPRLQKSLADYNNGSFNSQELPNGPCHCGGHPKCCCDCKEESSVNNNDNVGIKDLWEYSNRELMDVMGVGCQWSVEDNDKFDGLRKYLMQVHKSKGFDIDEFPGFILGLSDIVPVIGSIYQETDEDYGSLYREKDEVYENLAKLGIAHHNKYSGTNFLVEKVDKVNLSVSNYYHYYITFTAINVKVDGSSVTVARDTFQTQVSVCQVGKDRDVAEVHFCRHKSGGISLTWCGIKKEFGLMRM